MSSVVVFVFVEEGSIHLENVGGKEMEASGVFTGRREQGRSRGQESTPKHKAEMDQNIRLYHVLSFQFLFPAEPVCHSCHHLTRPPTQNLHL